jgi:hypothetical protein
MFEYYGPSDTAVLASFWRALIKVVLIEPWFPNHTLACLYGRSTRIATLSFNGVRGKSESVPRRYFPGG